VRGIDLRGVLAAGGSFSPGDPPFSRPALGGGWRPVLQRLSIGELHLDFSRLLKNSKWTIFAHANR
jgi:hypothetical protein